MHVRTEIEAELIAIEIEEPIEAGEETVHGTKGLREERPKKSNIRIEMARCRRS